MHKICYPISAGQPSCRSRCGVCAQHLAQGEGYKRTCTTQWPLFGSPRRHRCGPAEGKLQSTCSQLCLAHPGASPPTITTNLSARSKRDMVTVRSRKVSIPLCCSTCASVLLAACKDVGEQRTLHFLVTSVSSAPMMSKHSSHSWHSARHSAVMYRKRMLTSNSSCLLSNVSALLNSLFTKNACTTPVFSLKPINRSICDCYAYGQS